MSNQLPIVLKGEQNIALQKLLDRVICREAEAIELRQSKGPVAIGVLFVDVFTPIEGEKIPGHKTFAITTDGMTSEWLV